MKKHRFSIILFAVIFIVTAAIFLLNVIDPDFWLIVALLLLSVVISAVLGSIILVIKRFLQKHN